MKKNPIICLCIVILSCLLSAGKYRKYNDCNYLNSDATWHVLLTMTAYDETPVSIHRFLPIVSLGAPEDKNLRWGLTISDEYGNYYYTSFSTAGFLAPYLFLKALHLPFTESSLYVFNSLLYCISNVLLTLFLLRVFGDTVRGAVCCFISVFLYCTAPIILHGMGIVYWHQSLMQCTLLLQIMMYEKKKESRVCQLVFYILCFLNPYIEWTGFVANAGFGIAEVWRYGKERTTDARKKRVRVLSVICIFFLTVASFAAYSAQYLQISSPSIFFNTVLNRFFGRSAISVGDSVLVLLHSYVSSFNLLLFILLALFIVLLLVNRGLAWVKNSLLWKNKMLLFIVCFPLLENIIMMGHAITYPYDQMKSGILFALWACDWLVILLKTVNGKRISHLLLTVLVVCGLLNYYQYSINSDYRWKIKYRNSNVAFAEYLNSQYENSVIGCKPRVRGYTNLLFHRGIQECIEESELCDIAEAESKDYAVYLIEINKPWDMNQYIGAFVTDIKTGEEYAVIVGTDSTVSTRKLTDGEKDRMLEVLGIKK